MKKTQHQKIIDMCQQSGDFVCQSLFWQISKSPHKRRSEIEKMHGYRFEERKCVHGIVNSKDFKLSTGQKVENKPPEVMPKYRTEQIGMLRKPLTLF